MEKQHPQTIDFCDAKYVNRFRIFFLFYFFYFSCFSFLLLLLLFYSTRFAHSLAFTWSDDDHHHLLDETMYEFQIPARTELKKKIKRNKKTISYKTRPIIMGFSIWMGFSSIFFSFLFIVVFCNRFYFSFFFYSRFFLQFSSVFATIFFSIKIKRSCCYRKDTKYTYLQFNTIRSWSSSCCNENVKCAESKWKRTVNSMWEMT